MQVVTRPVATCARFMAAQQELQGKLRPTAACLGFVDLDRFQASCQQKPEAGYSCGKTAGSSSGQLECCVEDGVSGNLTLVEQIALARLIEISDLAHLLLTAGLERAQQRSNGICQHFFPRKSFSDPRPSSPHTGPEQVNLRHQVLAWLLKGNTWDSSSPSSYSSQSSKDKCHGDSSFQHRCPGLGSQVQGWDPSLLRWNLCIQDRHSAA